MFVPWARDVHEYVNFKKLSLLLLLLLFILSLTIFHKSYNLFNLSYIIANYDSICSFVAVLLHLLAVPNL